jgi:hypothetical protein
MRTMRAPVMTAILARSMIGVLRVYVSLGLLNPVMTIMGAPMTAAMKLGNVSTPPTTPAAQITTNAPLATAAWTALA